MLALHVGLPKTATTFLQYQVFKHQKRLTYIHNPKDWGPDAIEPALRRYVRADPADVPKLERTIDRILPDGDVLVSNENISLYGRDVWTGGGVPPQRIAVRLARLADRVGDLRVVVGIRRQDQWLGSDYAQLAVAFPEFGQQDFEQRLAALCDGPLVGAIGWLDYEASLAAVAEAVGSVLPVPMEMLSAEPEQTLRYLGEFIDCQGLDEIYRSQGKAKRHTRSVGHNQWQLIGRDLTVELPGSLADRIIRRFRNGNRRMARRYGFDLRALGYFPRRPPSCQLRVRSDGDVGSGSP